MLIDFLRQLKTGMMLLIMMSLLTGLVYPLLITGFAQLVFPSQANGSMLKKNGKIVGSKWIGQSFTDPKYFWSRPSATKPFPNNALASGASDFGLLNSNYLDHVKARITEIQKADPSNTHPIPVTLVTASASGLDPHISPDAAYYQIARIAKIRNIPEAELVALVSNNTWLPTLKLLGEARVNVLKLNYDLDELDKNMTRS